MGYDGYKRVKGRKRHIIVDVLGLMLGCFVSAANVPDIKAAPVIWVWALERFARLGKILADQGYQSQTAAKRLKQAYNCEERDFATSRARLCGRATALGC